MHIQNNNLSKP